MSTADGCPGPGKEARDHEEGGKFHQHPPGPVTDHGRPLFYWHGARMAPVIPADSGKMRDGQVIQEMTMMLNSLSSSVLILMDIIVFLQPVRMVFEGSATPGIKSPALSWLFSLAYHP